MSTQCGDIRELLSPYMDGQVSSRERELVEAHLGECQACADELAALRATVAMLRRMPQVAVPRSFALQEPPRRVFTLFSVLRVGSALAAAMFVVLLGVDVLRAGFIPVGSSTSTASPPAFGVMSAEKSANSRAADQSTKSLAPAAPQAAQAPSQSSAASAQTAGGASPSYSAAASPSASAAPRASSQPAAPVAGGQDKPTESNKEMGQAAVRDAAPGSQGTPPTVPASPTEPVQGSGSNPIPSPLRIGELATFAMALLSAGGALWVRRSRPGS